MFRTWFTKHCLLHHPEQKPGMVLVSSLSKQGNKDSEQWGCLPQATLQVLVAEGLTPRLAFFPAATSDGQALGEGRRIRAAWCFRESCPKVQRCGKGS